MGFSHSLKAPSYSDDTCIIRGLVSLLVPYLFLVHSVQFTVGSQLLLKTALPLQPGCGDALREGLLCREVQQQHRQDSDKRTGHL